MADLLKSPPRACFRPLFFHCLGACFAPRIRLRKALLPRGLALICWLLPFWVAAQTSVSGRVVEANVPVAWANVVLFSPVGQLVAATVTKDDGSFALEAAPGTYRLKISSLGFVAWEQAIELEKPVGLGSIVLQPSAATKLREVVVVGQKKLVEYQPDRVVFNVENSVAAAGGDAVGAVGAAPGVLVRNNTISMLGKGAARVLIDGRLLELSGEELVAYLRSIPASSIRNVEVISNPPAKYEASGDGGLININLKQGQANAWKNTTTLAYEQNRYGVCALQDNWLYSQNKVRLAISAGGKLGSTGIRQTLNTFYPGRPWELRYTGKQRQDNVAGRVAADYDLTARTSVGVQYVGSLTKAPSSRDYTTIAIFNPAAALDSLLVNTGNRQVSTRSHAFNTHLVSVLDTLRRRVSVDADYFTYDSDTDNSFGSNTFSPGQEFLGTSLAAQNVAAQQVRNFSAKADVEHPLHWANLAYGAKLSLTDSKSSLYYYNTITALPILDLNQSNTFNYQENTRALYVSGTRSLTAKLSVQVGLRLESTQTRGYSATLAQGNTNSYQKLFPSAYFTYQRDKNHSFQATYGRRVNRPGFGLLNPFRSYLNSTSYSEGNPFLQPSFVDNLEITYTYKGGWRTTAFSNRTTDGFGPVFTSDPTSNTLVISRQNYFTDYSFGLGESYAAAVTSWWQTQNQLYVLSSASRFVNNLQARPKNTPQLYASTSNTFTLGKSTKLQVDYTYSSPFAKGLYRAGYVSGLNVACRQGLLHNRVQASVLLNDVFNTAYLKGYTSTVNGVKQVYNENNGSRFLRFSLTYDFGNSQLQGKQRTLGNEEEHKRTE